MKVLMEITSACLPALVPAIVLLFSLQFLPTQGSALSFFYGTPIVTTGYLLSLQGVLESAVCSCPGSEYCRSRIFSDVYRRFWKTTVLYQFPHGRSGGGFTC